jgi:hypothetical protein
MSTDANGSNGGLVSFVLVGCALVGAICAVVSAFSDSLNVADRFKAQPIQTSKVYQGASDAGPRPIVSNERNSQPRSKNTTRSLPASDSKLPSMAKPKPGRVSYSRSTTVETVDPINALPRHEPGASDELESEPTY